MAKISQFLLWPIVYILSKFLYRIRIQGRENLKKINKPFIIISNHFSFFDSFLFRLILGFSTPNLPLRFMAVKNFNWFFLNLLESLGIIYLIYKIYGVVVVTPGLGIQKNLEKLKKAIIKKQNVVIYPEGSISKTGMIGPFKKGAAVLAIESGVPALPISFRLGKKKFIRKDLTINIGEPIYVKKDDKPEEVTNFFYEAITRLHEKMDNLTDLNK